LFSKEGIKEFVESILIAGVLAFFIINFIAQSFVVQGHSMEPTLSNGERLFVNKFIYYFRSPERGEIVVLDPPGDINAFIKRIIGLPGDEIEILDGKLYINNEPIEEDYINGEMYRDFGPHEVADDKYFVLGDNRNYSSDSRTPQIGDIPKDAINGKAFWLYWPLTEVSFIESASYNQL